MWKDKWNSNGWSSTKNGSRCLLFKNIRFIAVFAGSITFGLRFRFVIAIHPFEHDLAHLWLPACITPEQRSTNCTSFIYLFILKQRYRRGSNQQHSVHTTTITKYIYNRRTHLHTTKYHIPPYLIGFKLRWYNI